MQKLASISQKIIEFSFYLLFFSVPLVFYSKNYELFEYNKMMLTYAFTIIILTAWLIKSISNKKIEIMRTPFDKFLLLFLLSQILSTIFSIDVHVSIFGYYSRFHQGLLATVSYLILYFAFTSNFPKEKIKNIIYASFASAFIVSIWGILEHFGHSISCLIITGQFDVNCWVQDVQTRVFATLGQPNWMSAYLAILIPIAIGLGLTCQKIKSIALYFLSLIFYLSFLYTRSRSGFVALWISLIIFAALLFLNLKINKFKIDLKLKIKNLKLIVIPLIFILITFFAGSGISQIDKFTPVQTPKLGVSTSSTPALESGLPSEALAKEGGTESGQIRAIVWKGALDIFRHYPLFGSGVETFAFSYYKYRPIEHNLVSEWDFLYNKAHNEYLNFAATTGLFGTIAYLSFIIAFIVWFIKNNYQLSIINYALFIGWLTILITNFFGFSVVIVTLYFYLIPAMVFILNNKNPYFFKFQIIHPAGAAIGGIIAGLFLFYKLINFYLADIDYAAASSYAKSQKYKESYLFLTSAIEKNPLEPIYHDEISTTLANLAVMFAENKDNETAEKFASFALKESDIATRISPNNVTFYKSKTKMFYTLSVLDSSFIPRAIDSLEKAQKLAPTDAKIKYNLAILYGKNGDLERAISTLEKTAEIKPNYKDARYALALFYKDNGQTQKAIDELNYILKNIDPEDTEAKEKLNSWGAL